MPQAALPTWAVPTQPPRRSGVGSSRVWTTRLAWMQDGIMRRLTLLLSLVALLAGCATTQHRSRPFFLPEAELETHGRKTWLDHLIETDPGGTDFRVASDYQTHPPQRIAVLPFVDRGNGDYLVNKIPIIDRSEEDRDRWSWTHANRLRRAVTGSLAVREFVVIPLPAVDAVLQDRGIANWDDLQAVPIPELGRWLGADAVVYGELVDYEAYYGFLVAAWRVSSGIRMVSTRDGHEIFSCTDRRYAVNVSPAFDPVDILINSAINLLTFRDVALARQEYEVGREIVLRLPPAERNLVGFRSAAREAAPALDSETHRPATTVQPANLELAPGSSLAPAEAWPGVP